MDKSQNNDALWKKSAKIDHVLFPLQNANCTVVTGGSVVGVWAGCPRAPSLLTLESLSDDLTHDRTSAYPKREPSTLDSFLHQPGMISEWRGITRFRDKILTLLMLSRKTRKCISMASKVPARLSSSAATLLCTNIKLRQLLWLQESCGIPTIVCSVHLACGSPWASPGQEQKPAGL